MANTSTYLQQARLNQELRGMVLIPPTNVYLALFSADPTDAGNPANELTDAGYARIAMGTATGWSAPAAATGGGQQSANLNQVSFGAVQTTPVTVTHWATFDAPTGGNMRYHGVLAQAKAMQLGDVLQFPAGMLEVIED